MCAANFQKPSPKTTRLCLFVRLQVAVRTNSLLGVTTRPMRLEQLTLRELHMNLVAPFQTSMETTTVRRILLIEAVVEGVTGWGECVAGEAPSYSPETTDTAWHILRDHLWPSLKSKQFASAADVWRILAWVRGHNMAKG